MMDDWNRSQGDKSGWRPPASNNAGYQQPQFGGYQQPQYGGEPPQGGFPQDEFGGPMEGYDPMNPDFLSELFGGGGDGGGGGILPLLTGGDDDSPTLPSLGGSGISTSDGYGRYGPVLNDQQVQQMINRATSANAQQHGTTMRDALQNFGGRGMAGSSPAMRGVGSRADLTRAMADTAARTQIPIDASRLNVEAAIQGDMASAQQRGMDIRQYLAPHQAQQGYLSPLLGALSSFF